MFLPFLPFVFALAGLSLLVALPVPEVAAWSGGGALGVWLALLLPGVLLGLAPEPWGGSRSPMRLSRRRLALVGVWLALLETLDAPAHLAGLLGAFSWAEEGVILLLLGNFWLADALCMERFPLPPRAVLPFLHRLRGKMGISLPIVALAAAGIALSTAGQVFLEKTGSQAGPWLGLVGSFALYGFLAAVVLPALIPPSWGLRPLANPEAERIIREELQANGVRVNRVLNWPSEMLGHATAGVIGLMPPFRYLLVADLLADRLAPDELRSVTAHEAGHIRHRHLWFFFAALLAFVLLITLLMQALVLSGIWLDFTLPPWGMVVLEVSGLVLFVRFGVGFLSRHFERQADGDALARHGPGPFERAILKVAQVNGIAVGADNWHHYGIAHRIAFAHGAAADPGALRRHGGLVRRLQIACVAALALGAGAQAVFSSPGVVPYLADTFWIARLERADNPSPGEKQALLQLATQAYQQEDFAAAERYFRLLHRWNPADPTAQNNLAWLLVTRPGDDPGRVAEGLHLARSAATASTDAFIWDTLAEALSRADQPEAARSAAQRALLLAEAGQGRGNTDLGYYRSRLAGFDGHGAPERPN